MAYDKTQPVHFSALKHIGRSPAHYLANLEVDRDSPAMQMGRLIHNMVLGGTPYAVWEGDRRAGKDWEAFKAAHDGEEIFTRAQVDQALLVKVALTKDPVAGPLLFDKDYEPRDYEREFTWEMGGRYCVGTADLMSFTHVELKTTTNTQPDKLRRACRRMGYHAQMAWYEDGAAAAGLPAPSRRFLVAVEVTAPFAVTVLRPTIALMEEGRKMWRLWWETLMVCEATGEWPSYTQSVEDWDVEETEETLLIDGEEVTV